MSATKIRDGAEADLKDLTDIYNHYVRTAAITFDTVPFTLEERRLWLAGFAPTGPYRLLVAEEADGHVVGYASSSRFRVKAAYDTSVETTLYVHNERWREGIGAQLYAALFEELAQSAPELHRAYAAITLPNPASLALHAAFGFVNVGVCREVGKKLGKFWDVQWLEKPLS